MDCQPFNRLLMSDIITIPPCISTKCRVRYAMQETNALGEEVL